MWRKQSAVDKDNVKRILELETNALIVFFLLIIIIDGFYL
jgi:hypothetical protein